MGNYNDLSNAFSNRKAYKYDKHLSCDGTKIVDTRGKWTYDKSTNKWLQLSTQVIVLAEWVEHKGVSYPVVYNRSNKCYATEGLYWFSDNWWYKQRSNKLKYGEIGKCDKSQQLCYRSQLTDRLIGSGSVKYILIPTSVNGDSEFFKLI